MKSKSGTPNPRRADCHPERPHWVRGLCRHCYNVSPDIKAKKNSRQYQTTPIERSKQKVRRSTDSHKAADKVRKARYLSTDSGKKVQLAYFKSPKAKEKHRRVNLRRSFGITPESYDKMLEGQGGCCAICSKPPVRKRLAVDHCHRTGRIRGLLCDLCNRGIGMLKDNPVSLRKAAEYLEKSAGLTEE